MANTLNLGDGNWATREDSLLGYNLENNNFKPLPFDFTRSSSATRINKNGLIERINREKPRIDFLGNTKGALLLEPQRTNLFLNKCKWYLMVITLQLVRITYESFRLVFRVILIVIPTFGDNSCFIDTRYDISNRTSATNTILAIFLLL